MGICSTIPQYRVVKAHTLFSRDKKYPRSSTYKVKKRNSSKKIIGFHEYFLQLPDPETVSSFKAVFNTQTFWVSNCIIPSFNPKIAKKCKDKSLTIFHENILFVAIFDGYGAAGDIASRLCADTTFTFFHKNFESVNVNSI